MPDLSPLHAWQTDANATFDVEAGTTMPSHFSGSAAEYQAARSGAAVFDLSHRGAVLLTGADCVAFLHNLCTNEIKKLSPGHACEIFFTTHKARTVGHGIAHRLIPPEPPRLLLDLDPGSGARLAAHLDRYIVSEQAEVSDQTSSRAMIHVAGPSALRILEAIHGPLGDLAHLQSVEGGVLRITRNDRLAMPGWDLAGPSAEIVGNLAELVARGVVPAGTEAFEVLRVEAGMAVEGRDFDLERFVVEIGRTPQAISYGKGCYLGQEPIVMARDRGHANRALLGLRIAGQEPVQPGTKVLHGQDEVGEITSSVYSPILGSALALAYLKRGFQKPDMEFSVAGRPTNPVALPVRTDAQLGK